jgi:class 3 adenylate cyclase/tetratricopeptide (TPR) repeat protein
LRRGLSAVRRARQHSQIGDALEILYKESAEAHLGELAYHFFEGARGGGDVDRAIDYARRAGERAASLMAHDEAAEQYARALEAMGWRGKPDDAECCHLTLALGEAQHRAGETSGARKSFEAAAELARKLGAPELLGQAALGYIGSGMVTGQRDESLLSLLEEALAALGNLESPLRARVQARLASSLYFSQADRERRVRLSEEAVDIAKRIGDPQTLAYTLTALHRTLWVADTLERRIDVANDLVGAASASGDIDVALEGHGWIFVDLAEQGDIPGAMAHLDFYVRLAEGLKQPIHGWATTLLWAMLALLSGEHDRAEQLCNEALALGQKAQSPNAFPLYGGQLLFLRRQQGRSAEMIPLVQNLARQFPTVGAWNVALAMLYCDVGNRDAARAEVEQLAAADYRQINYDNLWLAAMAQLCLVAGYLDDARNAGALYERLQQFAGRNVIVANAIVSLGSMSRYLGILATVLERWDRAVEHFRHAIAFNTAMGGRPHTLYAQVDFARMLLRRGGRGDARSASALLNDALAGAQAIGMAGVVSDALELKLKAQGLGGRDPRESIEAVAAVVEAEQPNLAAQTAPDGTVTLLFSDIEASSMQNERLGDAQWMELLRIHNRLVREQVAAYDGYEVKSMGDGFMLAFRSASQALRCAIAIQRAFAALDSGMPDRIVVRIGLHTGEAIREADDFFGKHVNLAARIGGAAMGGEVLVSALLRELTASAGEFRFGSGREVELRGLAGRQVVYAVDWA